MFFMVFELQNRAKVAVFDEIMNGLFYLKNIVRSYQKHQKLGPNSIWERSYGRPKSPSPDSGRDFLLNSYRILPDLQ